MPNPQSITLVEAAKVMIRSGKPAVIQLAIAGKLSPRHVWLGVRGATRYIYAMADGDVASEEKRDGRTGICAGCPSVTGTGFEMYCGPPLSEHASWAGGGPTCGCAVHAKAAVDSEKCPQEKWP